MIQIIYMAKETYSSLESLKFLLSLDDVRIVRAVVRPTDSKLIRICKANCLNMCSEDDLRRDYYSGDLKADYIFSFYWKKIKKDILGIPRIGSINFHPGPLPEARGSGYHAAILENWGYFGVTAHFMDENFDTGGIIECRRFPISCDILNVELVRMTHVKLFELFQDVVNRLLIEGGGGRPLTSRGTLFQLSRIGKFKDDIRYGFA